MILITGATGNIGSELLKQLIVKSADVRVVTRDEKKVSHLNPAIEAVIGDRQDPTVIKKALQGTDKVFLLPVLIDEKHEADRLLIDEAKRANVDRIVMISSGVLRSNPKNPIGVLHREVELLIEESGIPWTVLRPGGFTSNALRFWADTIKSLATVFNPTGDGKSAPIAPYDIAAVAAVALTAAGHEARTYYLTGPELLSTHDQVNILSKVIGQPIQCIDIPAEVAAERLASIGLPEPLVQGLYDVWIQVRNHEGTYQTNEVERLTGQPAQTFETWCGEHRSAFL
jgi:(4-alkanoyl-5-oxo-2,5-dihydrofuran-3-yl)methyl phosphate reductase